MDINDFWMLGFCDKMFEFEDDEYLVDIMEEIIDDVKLSLIVIFYSGYGVYFDYDVCGEVVICVLYWKKKEDCLCMFCMVIICNREEVFGEVDVVFDIKEVVDIKMNVLRVYCI